MSPIRLDLKNQRFGRLVAIKSSTATAGRTGWICKCDCGKKKLVGTRELTRGETKSCGCLSEENRINFIQAGTSHGRAHTRTYMCWKNMKARCYNPNNSFFKEYGARGITVCKRWRLSFESFYKDMGDKPSGMTIDRFPDNDGNYEPSNCRWATNSQQSRNKRNNIFVEVKNERMIVKDACRILGLPYRSITARIRKGWDAQKAMNTPIRKGKYK